MIIQCPDHVVMLVPAPIDGFVFCPIPGCHWWHGWPVRRTFVAEAKIERAEELREAWLQPTQDDVQITPDATREERPATTL